MSRYRLELWFDFNNPSTQLNWGISKANVASDTTFSEGGTAMAAPGGVVTIPDGTTSNFDIYLIDVTNDGVSRMLNSIEIDWEAAPGSTGRDPVSGARNLRNGMNGQQFCGASEGYTTTPTELTVYSASPNVVGQRRWSLADGFEQLTVGHYTFTGNTTVCLTNDVNQSRQFTFDPEMDINN